MMTGRKYLFLAGAAVLVLATAGLLWALCPSVYNRPEPLMDYVPQQIGIYDTGYDNLGELDCRGCHGGSLADRHHYTDTVILYGLCTPCHEIDPSLPGGVEVINDCATPLCHSWDDVLGTGGWHHVSNDSGSFQCTQCHDTNVVAELQPFEDYVMRPATVVTPTPFSCENCHWSQPVVTAGTVEHPATYDYYDQWGNGPSYKEYGKPIAGNFDSHHFGLKGNVYPQCVKCHGNDPETPSWLPDDPELIRWCETCHNIATLHHIEPHVGPGGTGDPPAVNGWEAAGYRTITQDPIDECADVAPTTYRTFTANEQCIGCHGGFIDDDPPTPIGAAPVINSISPVSGCPNAIVELTGSNFGEEHIPGREVQVRVGPDWSTPVSLPIYSWTDVRIEVLMPTWTFTAGNLRLRVFLSDAPGGMKKSNVVVFTLKDCSSPKTIDPANGVCKTLIRLENPSGTFGAAQDEPAEGVYHAVQISGTTGDYIAKNVTLWSNTLVRFRFKDFFEDLNGNYVEDPGEPTISICDGLFPNTYSVRLMYIFYTDDVTVGYDGVEVVSQVEASNPKYFELTDDPYIFGLNPKQINIGELLRINGINFGPMQETGEVHIGTRRLAQDPTLGLGRVLSRRLRWSNTRIRVKVTVPVSWAGKNRYVWVEKAGVKSNYRKLVILP